MQRMHLYVECGEFGLKSSLLSVHMPGMYVVVMKQEHGRCCCTLEHRKTSLHTKTINNNNNKLHPVRNHVITSHQTIHSTRASERSNHSTARLEITQIELASSTM
jgi:hypothetical protein